MKPVDATEAGREKPTAARPSKGRGAAIEDQSHDGANSYLRVTAVPAFCAGKKSFSVMAFVGLFVLIIGWLITSKDARVGYMSEVGYFAWRLPPSLWCS